MGWSLNGRIWVSAPHFFNGWKTHRFYLGWFFTLMFDVLLRFFCFGLGRTMVTFRSFGKDREYFVGDQKKAEKDGGIGRLGSVEIYIRYFWPFVMYNPPYNFAHTIRRINHLLWTIVQMAAFDVKLALRWSSNPGRFKTVWNKSHIQLPYLKLGNAT